MTLFDMKSVIRGVKLGGQPTNGASHHGVRFIVAADVFSPRSRKISMLLNLSTKKSPLFVFITSYSLYIVLISQNLL
jgi:hypothetical protein